MPTPEDLRNLVDDTEAPIDVRGARQRVQRRFRRQRRVRAASIGAVCAMVLVAGAVAVRTNQPGPSRLATRGGSSTTREPSASTTTTMPANPGGVLRPTGATLLTASFANTPALLNIVDADTGRVTALPTPPRLEAFDNFEFLARGSLVVTLADSSTGAGHSPEDVYAYHRNFAGPGVKLGRATAMLPSTKANRVWLSTDFGTGAGEHTIHFTEVDMTGHVTDAVTLTLPSSGTFFLSVVPVKEGFVAWVEATTGTDNEGTVERFDTTGKYRGTVDHGSLVDAQGDIVVVSTGSRLVSHDLASGSSHSYELGGHTRGGAIAPDSRSVALVSDLDSRLEILRLDSGSIEKGPAVDPGSLQWAPSGRDVFLTAENQKHIDVWQVAERHHARVQVELGFVAVVCLLPG